MKGWIGRRISGWVDGWIQGRDRLMDGRSVGIRPLGPKRVTFLNHYPVIGPSPKGIISDNCLLCDTRKSSTSITFRCFFLMGIYTPSAIKRFITFDSVTSLMRVYPKFFSQKKKKLFA